MEDRASPVTRFCFCDADGILYVHSPLWLAAHSGRYSACPPFARDGDSGYQPRFSTLCWYTIIESISSRVLVGNVTCFVQRWGLAGCGCCFTMPVSTEQVIFMREAPNLPTARSHLLEIEFAECRH
jgi:hypothetical protein